MRAPIQRLTVMSLLLASALATPSWLVQAKGVTSLEPQTGWKQTKADTYCTVTQRYMDNVVLNYARNNRGERSIALDMQAGRFTAGKDVPVQVKSGSVTRAYMLQPASESLLIINLGGGDEMEKAIAATQKLDITVNGETFRVNTADFNGAATQLTSCVSGLPQAPQVAPTPAPVAAPIAAPIATKGAESFKPEIAPPAAIPVPEDIAAMENALQIEKPPAKIIPPAPKVAAATATNTADAMVAKAAATDSKSMSEKLLGDKPAAVKPVAKKPPETLVAAVVPTEAKPPVEKSVEKQVEKQVEKPAEKLMIIKPRDRSADIARAKAAAKAEAEAVAKAEAEAQAKAKQAEMAKAQAAAEAKAKADAVAKAQAEEAAKQAAMAKAEAEKKAKEQQQIVKAMPDAVQEPLALVEKPNEAGTSRDYYQPKPQAKLSNAQELKSEPEKAPVSKAPTKIIEAPKAPVVAAVASSKDVKHVKTEVPEPKVSKTDLGFVDFTKDAKPKTDKEIVGAKPFAQFDKENTVPEKTIAQPVSKAADSLGPLEDDMQALKVRNAALENELRVAKSNMRPSDEDNTLPSDESLDVVIPVGERKQDKAAPVSEQTAAARYAEAQREIQRLAKALQDEKDRRVRERQELADLMADPLVNGADEQERIALLEADLSRAQIQLDQLKSRVQRKSTKIAPNPYDFDGDGSSVFGGEFYDPDKQVAKRTGAGYESPSQADRRMQAQRRGEVKMPSGFGGGANSLAIDESLLMDGAAMPKVRAEPVEVTPLKAAPPPAPVKKGALTPPPPPMMASNQPDDVFADDPIAAELSMRGTPMAKSDESVETSPLPNRTSPNAADVVSVSKPSALSAPPQKAGTPRYWQTNDYQQLLKSSGLSLKGSVSLVPSGQTSSLKMYRWQSDTHTGTAEQQPLTDMAGYDIMVQTYIDRYKSRCGGEFAADPTDLSQGATKANGYEIACVGAGGKGSGASLLFFARDGLFTVIALEGAPDAMAQAMEERDRLAMSVGKKSS